VKFLMRAGSIVVAARRRMRIRTTGFGEQDDG